MNKRLIMGIIIAIIIIVGLGAYMGTQNQKNIQLNLTNASNGTTNNSSSVNSNDQTNQNSNNQVNKNTNSKKSTVDSKRVICPACHGSGWDACMICSGTGKEGNNVCSGCNGAGKFKCEACGGDGYIDHGDKGYSGQQ